MSRRRRSNRIAGDPEASEIVETLRRIEAISGWRPEQIWDDFLHLAETGLRVLPEVAARAAASRELAEHPAVVAAEAEIAPRYQRWPEVRDILGAAFVQLLKASDPDDMRDLLGPIYMLWVIGNERAGQFFTPWHICQVLAAMNMGSAEAEVHRRIKTAIAGNPAAEAAVLAGLTLEGKAAQEWYFTRVLPLVMADVEPVTICDPACGSGGMLLAAAEHVPIWMSQAGLVRYYGIDLDLTCVRMTRINLMRYGIYHGSIAHGDALAMPFVEPAVAETGASAKQRSLWDELDKAA